VASAVEDGQTKELIEKFSRCRAVQHDAVTTRKLHEKHSFTEYTRSIGLSVPETHTVTSRAAVLKILENAQSYGTKFIMKYIGIDDSLRGNLTLLPLATSANTEAHIARLPISVK
jgi:catechol O-methyltransferase